MTPRWILALSVFGMVFTGCEGGKKKEETQAAVGRKVPVEAVSAVRRNIRDTLIATSTVESRNTVDIVAEIPGVVVALDVEQGDFVKKRQRLARINREELNLGVQAADSAVGRLKAEVERLRPLRAKGVISQQMFDEAKYRLEEARGEQRRAQTAASDLRVTSPLDGVVAMRNVNIGQQVATGTPLFRIVDPDDLIVAVNFPENALGTVYQGQNAYVESEALQGATFAATVDRISPVVDPRTGTVRVVLDVQSDHPIGEPADAAKDQADALAAEPNVAAPKRTLRPGMFVKAFVVTAERPNALVIPRRAVVYLDDRPTVFAVTDGVARRTSVTLGVSEGPSVEVVDGIEDGASVVVLGQDGLKDGTPVDVELRPSDDS